MKKCVSYCMTRNIYPQILPSLKSLLANNNIDTVYLITEDNEIGIWMPDNVKIINVSGQKWFRADSPNYYSRFTYMVMMRMALPFILKDEDMVLSLDLDTIIQTDISELWDLNMDDKYVAGCTETELTKHKGYPYINCGVMMINLAKMRDGMAERIIKLLNEKRYLYNEQDCMNEEVPEENKLILPSAFNFGFFNKDKACVPAILHYAAFGRHFMEQRNVIEWRDKDWSEILK